VKVLVDYFFCGLCVHLTIAYRLKCGVSEVRDKIIVIPGKLARPESRKIKSC
jgi:hypothetical protein